MIRIVGITAMLLLVGTFAMAGGQTDTDDMTTTVGPQYGGNLTVLHRFVSAADPASADVADGFWGECLGRPGDAAARDGEVVVVEVGEEGAEVGGGEADESGLGAGVVLEFVEANAIVGEGAGGPAFGGFVQ